MKKRWKNQQRKSIQIKRDRPEASLPKQRNQPRQKPVGHLKDRESEEIISPLYVEYVYLKTDDDKYLNK